MDQQAPQVNRSLEQPSSEYRFKAGDVVVYFPHGKCTVTGIETRRFGENNQVGFYRLEVQKSTLSRSAKKEPAIWVPLKTATAQGLRPTAAADEVSRSWQIFESRDCYLDTSGPWNKILMELEALIRKEGFIGLAKAASFLHVYKKKFVIPPSEVTKFSESVTKHVCREISDVSGEFPKMIEERLNKAMRHKLLPEQ